MISRKKERKMLKLNTKLNRVGRGKYRIVYKIAIMNGKEKKKRKPPIVKLAMIKIWSQKTWNYL